eukprot:164204_1
METGVSAGYVKLVSTEGDEFWVDRKCAMVSKVIKTMLEGNFTESRGEVTFGDIRAPILEKVIQYMYYNVKYTSTSSKAPDFPVELDMAIELLKISHFLEC